MRSMNLICGESVPGQIEDEDPPSFDYGVASEDEPRGPKPQL